MEGIARNVLKVFRTKYTKICFPVAVLLTLNIVDCSGRNMKISQWKGVMKNTD